MRRPGLDPILETAGVFGAVWNVPAPVGRRGAGIVFSLSNPCRLRALSSRNMRITPADRRQVSINIEENTHQGPILAATGRDHSNERGRLANVWNFEWTFRQAPMVD